MPTYEYKCQQCRHGFEIKQSIKDKPLITCEECGGQLNKVFSPIGMSFQGKGFYRNDHGATWKSQLGNNEN